ncbi:MAG: branched-chain amino acid ABC transporter permease [Pseudorhodoplanes sp.]
MNRGNLAALAIATSALIALPHVITHEFYINMASQCLIFAILALSLNLMLGFGGMVSLGHAAYIGIAGYTCILLTVAGYHPLLAAAAGLVLSTACAGLFGMLSLRAPGLGFLMITLALGQIVWGIAYRANTLTGGDNGISLPARPMPFGFEIKTAISFYYFTLVVFVIALFGMWRFQRSPFGASLMGTRDQPRRMRMLGHNVWMVQWLTFVIAGFWGSVGGLMFVYYNVFLSPHALTLQQSAEILLMAILGGANSLTGPIVGAAIVTLVKNVVSSYVERWNSLLGAIFIIVIIFMPYGLVPGCRTLWNKLTSGGNNSDKPRTPAAEPAE